MDHLFGGGFSSCRDDRKNYRHFRDLSQQVLSGVAAPHKHLIRPKLLTHFRLKKQKHRNSHFKAS